MTTNRAGRCHVCGYVTDAVSGIKDEDDVPKTGDATLCLNCGAVMIFTPFGQRLATPAELAEVMADPIVTASIAHIRARGFIPHYRREASG